MRLAGMLGGRATILLPAMSLVVSQTESLKGERW